MYAPAHALTQTHTQHTHTYKHAHIRTHTYARIQLYVYTAISPRYLPVHTRTHIRTNTHVHTHTHTNTLQALKGVQSELVSVKSELVHSNIARCVGWENIYTTPYDTAQKTFLTPYIMTSPGV